jgi:MFS family permease
MSSTVVNALDYAAVVPNRVASFSEVVRQSQGLARLAAIRWSSQFGDGFFQAALSGAILFNPERQTRPAEVAIGFVVLLLPYSLIGPFAGAMLDRWDRRRVLIWATVLRGAFTAIAALLLFTSAAYGSTGYGGLLVLALAAVGVSRFMMAGVSAALPNIVSERHLVAANSVLATVGAAMAGVGAAASIVLVTLLGGGDAAVGAAVLASFSGFLAAALAASRFAPRALGPHLDPAEMDPAEADLKVAVPGARRRSDAAAVRAVAAGLATGARAVWRSPGVASALAALGGHRLTFGINTLIMVLLLREPSSSVHLPGGLAGFGVAIAATATGMLLAACVTPFVIPWLGRTRTIVAGTVLGLIVQVTLVTALTQGALLLAALLLGVAGQTIKLSGDAAMQIEIADSERGQVFALQDTVFNIGFVAAIGLAALAIPPDGRSLPIALAGAGIYCASLAVIALNSRRQKFAAPHPAGPARAAESR